MSIKNQSRLPIFGSIIIGVTIVCLFGLNLLVDNVSKIIPPSMARQEQPRPGLRPPMGANPNAAGQPDDEFKSQGQSGGGPPGRPGPSQQMRSPGPDTPYPGQEGVMRRVRNGRNSFGIQPKGPPPPSGPQQNGAANKRMPNGAMTPPVSGPGDPMYPPGGMNLTPEERDAMERELERRRQMMQDGGQNYGPNYYPPPPDYYQNPYDNGYYDEYDDYDYDSGYQGKLKDTKETIVELSDQDQEDEDYDPDDYLADDYFSDDEDD